MDDLKINPIAMGYVIISLLALIVVSFFDQLIWYKVIIGGQLLSGVGFIYRAYCKKERRVIGIVLVIAGIAVLIFGILKGFIL